MHNFENWAKLCALRAFWLKILDYIATSSIKEFFFTEKNCYHCNLIIIRFVCTFLCWSKLLFVNVSVIFTVSKEEKDYWYFWSMHEMMMNMCVEISFSSVNFFTENSKEKSSTNLCMKAFEANFFIDNPLELDKVLILSWFFKLFVNV